MLPVPCQPASGAERGPTSTAPGTESLRVIYRAHAGRAGFDNRVPSCTASP